MEEQVFKPLKFSYDSLPDYQYRQCFLYFSLFPEDHQKFFNSLIKCLIGEGLISKLDSRQAEFDKGNAILNELINASLLELVTYDGRKFVKMHDVVRHMALIVMRENFKAQDGLELQGLSEDTEPCVNLKSVLILKDLIIEWGVSNLVQNCSKLSTLIFDADYFSLVWELPTCFFADMQNLAVLDMSFLEIKLLPDSISNLTNLRVLLLRSCYSLEYIPSLSELKNLWHLDLYSTNLKEIPNGMESLINLSVLKLSWSSCEYIPSVSFLDKLSHLQILKLEQVEVEADVLISLEKLATLRIVFYNLESLISYLKSGHWKGLVEYHIAYLREKGIWKYGLLGEDKYKKVMYFDKLRDFGGQKWETDIVLPNNIQYLVLEVWNGRMVDLLMSSAFDNLQRLEIFGCEGMHLFSPALAQRVLNVETLQIGEWDYRKNEVEEIISSEEEFFDQINNHTTIKLPKLKSFKLMWLTNLRSIYKGRMMCPSLEHIVVDSCGKLERLPFCMQEDRKNENRIKLTVSLMPNQWWDSLQWDDLNSKSMYNIYLENT